ncbi:MAG: hypothetical protein IJZ79_07205 [Bacilli bacterium]|nr:hypothetical protein [Bacilli bacterium]
MEQNKKRDVFYGVVAIATLIVALVGATLAYFSITVNSDPGAVNASSKMVEISYEDSKNVIAQADELIPADFETVVQKAYLNAQSSLTGAGANASNLCVDKPGKDAEGKEIPGRQVCSIYRFTIGNNGTTDFNIIAAVNSELNEFVGSELSYALYDVEAGNWVDLGGSGIKTLGMTYCNNSDTEETKKCFTENEGLKEYVNNSDYKATNYLFDKDHSVKIEVGKTKTYDLIIYLKETGHPQNDNQGKKYNGTIKVELSGSALDVDGDGQISGKYVED